MWNLPNNKTYPSTAVQCDHCGGWGCLVCESRGWLPAGHPKGRHCARDGCGKPIPPHQLAVYCSDRCACRDA